MLRNTIKIVVMAMVLVGTLSSAVSASPSDWNAAFERTFKDRPEAWQKLTDKCAVNGSMVVGTHNKIIGCIFHNMEEVDSKRADMEVNLEEFGGVEGAKEHRRKELEEKDKQTPMTLLAIVVVFFVVTKFYAWIFKMQREYFIGNNYKY